MAYYNPQLDFASSSAVFNYQTTPLPQHPGYRYADAASPGPAHSKPNAFLPLHVALNSAYTCRDCNIPLRRKARPHRTPATQRCSINVIRGTTPTQQEIADFDFTLVLYTADNRPHAQLYQKLGGTSLQFAPTRENPNNYCFTLMDAYQNVAHHPFAFVREQQPDGGIVAFRSFGEFDRNVRLEVFPNNSAAILHRSPGTMRDKLMASCLGGPTVNSEHWEFPTLLLNTGGPNGGDGQTEALIIMACIIVFKGLNK
uniref:Uncharacterized protein n=1 Tax=Mycena chlorophos TaxID=658473 RepID=A0ABQ0LCG0_MYCCL|nr:predicted protein [Mycena chlorophos]